MLSRVQFDDITVRNEMLGTDRLAFERAATPDSRELERARQVPSDVPITVCLQPERVPVSRLAPQVQSA
jgi:hypothetical protein